ncbi:MAG: DciA family protein [Proteobacteria bacterium]|nr:DciA family protein [Pseudomonadota bacterium]
MNGNPQLRSLLDSVQTLTALQQQFALVAPPYFALSSQVLGLHQGTLSIATSNGTLAAKLRQLAPELVTKLQDRGCEVSGIRVRVQVSYAPVVHKPPPRILSGAAQTQLHELSASLSDSPLKLALEKFSQKKD